MTDELRKARTQAIYWCAMHHYLFDQAYPDIGPGATWRDCLYRAKKDLGYTDEQLILPIVRNIQP